MSEPTIITCAVTGNTTVQQHPGIPCTPEQIADACIAAGRAGAAIAHIHARYPDGRPSMELAHYREVVERIRASDVDLIIDLTTGPGSRFVPSDDEPRIAAPGTSITTPQRRVEHVVALRPEICTLDFNTMFSNGGVIINTPRNLRIMADAILEVGTTPELEVFDSGDIQLANEFIRDNVLATPSLFQLVLGVKYGAVATPTTMMYMKSLLPEGAHWAGFQMGPPGFPAMAQAWLLGGHVRVGLEDNIYLESGVIAPDNSALVQKAVRILTELGAKIATPAQAREMLSLKKMAPLPSA